MAIVDSRVETDMDAHIIQALKDEHAALMRKLQAVETTIAAYEGVVPKKIGATKYSTPQRAPAKKTLEIRKAVRGLIVPRGSKPTPTRELVSYLKMMSIDVGGKNPIATLSALLSHSEGFKSIGRSGWIIDATDPQNAEGSDATTSEPSNKTDSDI